MKRILISFVFIVYSAISIAQDYQFLNDRQYLITLPKNYDQEKAYPLLLAFHGAYSNALQMRQGTNFDKETADEGYIVVYPESKVENWNEGCECNKPHRLGIDDVKFIDDLITHLNTAYNIDIARIYLVGFSQGGLFAHYLACELSETVTAIAVVAATMSLPVFNNCTPAKNTSVLMIHGTADEALPWEGEKNGTFTLVSANKAFLRWRELNHCENKTTNTYYETPVQSIRITGKTTKTCDGDTKISLIKIEGGKHNWPTYQGFDATIEIINFFESLK